MSQSSPEGIILGKGSRIVSASLSINKEKVFCFSLISKTFSLFIEREAETINLHRERNTLINGRISTLFIHF